MDKFDNFKDAVEGHYRQQQAPYLFNKEFVRQYNAVGASCYLNFTGLTAANQVIKDVELCMVHYRLHVSVELLRSSYLYMRMKTMELLPGKSSLRNFAMEETRNQELLNWKLWSTPTTPSPTRVV